MDKLNSANEEVLHQVASELLNGFLKRANFVEKAGVKFLVNRVAKRFEADHIDKEALRYIIFQVLLELRFFDTEVADDFVINSGPDREVVEKILQDIRKQLNSKASAVLLMNYDKDSLLETFELKLLEAGLNSNQAVDLAQAFWDEAQRKLAA